MNTNKILKISGQFILMAMLFMFTSCTKSSDDALTKEQQDRNTESASIEDNDISESYEDLLNVDYREFYDQLSAHGEWIQVNSAELGIQPSTALSGETDNNRFSASGLFGINEARASATAASGMVFVWKPSVELVPTQKETVNPIFTPYTNGQWVNTDAGWYFKAPTPVEETVSHYGRWVNSPEAGWLWVPGRVWAPAWVDWKQNENYVSWAPLPPSANLVNGLIVNPLIADNEYVIVERKYFLEPQVYRYNNLFYDNGNRIQVSELLRTDGIVVTNNTIFNRGPDVNVIQKVYGRNIEMVKVHRSVKYSEVKYSDKEYTVYTPGFKRYKNKGNTRVTFIEPKKYKNYEERKVKRQSETEFENKSNDKDYNKKDDNNGKGNKDNDNGNINKGNNNNNKGNDNGNINKEKGKNNKGSDNGNINKGNDKGNNNKGSNKGNDNGKGKK